MVKRTQQSMCDVHVGEVFREESSGEAFNLAACKKSCEAEADCNSITYFTQSKYCSHFKTKCTKRTPAPNAIAMAVTGMYHDDYMCRHQYLYNYSYTLITW